MRLILVQGISSIGSHNDLEAVPFQARFPDSLQHGVILDAQDAKEGVALGRLRFHS
jgi:hypothetical protein